MRRVFEIVLYGLLFEIIARPGNVPLSGAFYPARFLVRKGKGKIIMYRQYQVSVVSRHCQRAQAAGAAPFGGANDDATFRVRMAYGIERFEHQGVPFTHGKLGVRLVKDLKNKGIRIIFK